MSAVRWVVEAQGGAVELCPVGTRFDGTLNITVAFRRAKALAGWRNDEMKLLRREVRP